jgi:hypothetical protein
MKTANRTELVCAARRAAKESYLATNDATAAMVAAYRAMVELGEEEGGETLQWAEQISDKALGMKRED